MQKKELIFIILVLVFLGIVFICIKKNNNKYVDTIKYEGKTYVLLEYNMDVFTYNYNNSNNTYYEEDIIHIVPNDKWNIAFFNGDLFVLENEVKEAAKYYSDDKNYEWFITFEKGDTEIKKSIDISKKELEYLYNIESINKTKTIVFEDIIEFVDIVKVSKDGFISALMTLIQHKDGIFWKTEIMTDDDREYIVKLPDSLNKKIFDILKGV